MPGRGEKLGKDSVFSDGDPLFSTGATNAMRSRGMSILEATGEDDRQQCAH